MSVSSQVKVIAEIGLSVFLIKFKGNSLELFIIEHWLAKKQLNNSAFFLKSVTYFLSWSKGGMQGIFLLFNNVFNIESKFLDLSSDPSIFLIYVSNIFLGYVQLNFSVVFEDTLLYEISQESCHLKYNFYIYRFSLELAAWCCC